MIRRKLIYDLKGALNSAMDRKVLYINHLNISKLPSYISSYLKCSIQTFPLNSSTPTTNMNRWTINRIHHVSYTWSMGPDPRENCGSGSTISFLSLSIRYWLSYYHTVLLLVCRSACKWNPLAFKFFKKFWTQLKLNFFITSPLTNKHIYNLYLSYWWSYG